jgi:N-acyl-D-amino-acid deacylase
MRTGSGFLFPAAALLLLVLLPASGGGDPGSRSTADYDVLIRGGEVIDGTGASAVRADVAIRGEMIVAVGDLADATASEILDATGKVVAPGFIDLHSHADRGILRFRSAENVIRQGVTTLLCGNCGSSPVDVGEFFEQVRNEGTGPNVALLIGHSSIRREVIGPHNVPPDDDQLAEMRRLVRQAMQEGAVGLSTGLAYAPGNYATTEELIALARELKPFGGIYVTHMRDEGPRILQALEEALQIGRVAEVPVHISHHKISSTSVFGLTRQTLIRIDEARAAGQDVTLDQYPYAAGSGSLQLYVPQESLSGGIEAYRRRIADPPQRERIVKAVEELLLVKVFEAGQHHERSADVQRALARIQIARATHDPGIEGKTVPQILQNRGQEVTLRSGAELLVDLVAEGTRGINHTLDDRPGGDVERVMQHPQTCIASDGGVPEFGIGHPHPRSYGCYPRVFRRYVRERKLLTLEEAIHKMTALPACRLGWTDRGVVRAETVADLVVFDPQTVSDRATFLEPHRYAVGIEHVIVNGRFVLKRGEMTAHLPGRPLPPGSSNAVNSE